MMRSGFTLFIEPGSLFSTAVAAQAVERVGIRALFAPLYLWDRYEPFDAIPALVSERLIARAPIDSKRSLKQLKDELHRNHNPDALIRGYIFVYGEGTASPELLIAAHACAAEHDVPLHLHAGYTPEGAQIYRSMTGTSQIRHLRDLGLLDGHTVIVHANVLDKEEETAVQETGCQIIWCPTGFFSLGIAKQFSFMMRKRCRAGTRISLGTDGAFDFPPSETIRAARLMSQAYTDPISPEELLEMHTVNAANAAGLEAELGSLEIGKRADLVIRDPFAAEAYPDINICHVLALTLGAGSVRTVMVDGRIVFDDGHPTQVEERDIYRKVSRSVRERARRLDIDPGPEWPLKD
jgi:cytosine/adenosine deaminase-related metal-dependent hydrolase